MLVDSHCHLDYPDFEEEGVAEIVTRAQSAGVGHFLTICTEISKFPQVLKIAESSPLIHCTVGTHPHHAADAGEVNVTKEELIAFTQHPKVVGIGETGLDYYYDHSPREEQQRIFSTHIEAACETALPLVIHTRDADDDTLRLMRDAGQGKAAGVMHCFSGGPRLAEESLALGFYISFSGILTFKKAEELREVAKMVPMDKVLVETDSPYLAPVPNRGKRNEPSYVVHTARVLAELKGVSPEALAEQTTENFFRLFNKAKE
ncbi:MAG: YchF/TatD family DNA exonuclease [Alphaproteobacteria bacterium]|nr:YchF/TatD family DNA exonuclease [Alphaproteobacteria bacterium]